MTFDLNLGNLEQDLQTPKQESDSEKIRRLEKELEVLSKQVKSLIEANKLQQEG